MEYKFLVNILSNTLLSIEVHDATFISTTHFNPKIYRMVIGAEEFGLAALKGADVITSSGDETKFDVMISQAIQ